LFGRGRCATLFLDNPIAFQVRSPRQFYAYHDTHAALRLSQTLAFLLCEELRAPAKTCIPHPSNSKRFHHGKIGTCNHRSRTTAQHYFAETFRRTSGTIQIHLQDVVFETASNTQLRKNFSFLALPLSLEQCENIPYTRFPLRHAESTSASRVLLNVDNTRDCKIF
jgi:hypothetical protein